MQSSRDKRNIPGFPLGVRTVAIGSLPVRQSLLLAHTAGHREELKSTRVYYSYTRLRTRKGTV